MNGIVAWFARNAVAANLLMIVAFIGGIISFNSMERRMFPTADISGATVTVAWPGASPQDVEEQIILRIEEAIADLEGIEFIISIGDEGRARLNIKGRDDLDKKEFIDEIKLRVDQVSNLPQSSFPPQVNSWEERNSYMGIALHGNVDQQTLKRVADEVRDDIASLPGGELAEVNGTVNEQIAIEVSEENLRRYRLTFSDVANAVRASSVNASGGRVRTNTGQVSLSTRSLAGTDKEFGNIIIAQTTEGGTVRVKDVATVIEGFEEDQFDARYDNEPSAYIMVASPDRMDISTYTTGIKAYIEKANAPGSDILPEAMQIDMLWDDSLIFDARMDLIQTAALQGALLVMIILVLFLRPVVAFWVTIGIITAFAGGIMLLPFLGVSWNILSTFAVLLVIGVIVDDAIIVGENIYSEVESGRREGLDASIVGTQLVLKPVIFGVLTTIIAFLPWAFITGPMRQFTQQISFVVLAALIFSIIECMLILPAHLSHMKKQEHSGATGWFTRIQRRAADSLLWVGNNIYKPVLELAIRFRYVTIAFFFSLFMLATSIVANQLLPFRFFPEIEGDLVYVSIELPDGTPFSRSLQVKEQLQNGIDILKAEKVEEWPDIEGGLVQGASVAAFDRRIQAWIGLTPPEQRDESITTKSVSDRLRELVGPIPDADEVQFEFTMARFDTGIRYSLSHEDMDVLREAAQTVKDQMATYGSVYDISDNLTSSADELQITLKPGASALGVTLADISRQIRQAYYGEEAQRIPRKGGDVRVMVRLPEEARRDLDSLRNLRIRTPDGRAIPVGQVADFAFAPGISRVLRRDRQRSIAVFAEVEGDNRPRIYADMEENFWPIFAQRYPTVTRGNLGGVEEEQEFYREVQILLLIAIGTMYILLAVAFGSYWQPLLLMTALPFAFCGAVFGHLAFGLPMAMFSLFGIAAAAGVVINDNLVLVDFVNRRRSEGAGAVQALVDGGVTRFRPILLTSITTFVGILPLMAERSVQAQFLKPMIVSLGCAVAFALFVSLLFVPALYAAGTEVGRVFRWAWGGRPYRSIGERYSGDVLAHGEDTGHGPMEDGLPSGVVPAE